MSDIDVGLTQLGGGLQKGLDTLDLDQKVTFDLYARTVLPYDGYVFWLKASDMTPSALLAAVKLNNPGNPNPVVPPFQLIVGGSVHYATDEQQEGDASFAINRVVFTAKSAVQDLNYVGPQLIYVASFDGVRFAFSSREMFYQQADLWHYQGNAVFSTMESQLIDDVDDFDDQQLIVSNSLPAWLNMQTYGMTPWPSGPPWPTNPPWPVLIPFPAVPIYPSFAAPANLAPPFITIHIDPEVTAAFQSAPYLTPNLSHRQLSHDTVEVTTYGLNNDVVLQFLDAVLQYSLDTGYFGIMNMPVPVDDKKTQTELLILAQKKRIVFEVSYVQASVRSIAQQLVDSCLLAVSPQNGPPLLPSHL